jgi:hypothetical protein
MINRNNYEIYFVDYLDGKLDTHLKQEFYAFLKANPDLKAELQDVAEVSLPESKVVYPDKDQLFKGKINELNFNDYAVGKMEYDLTPADLADFDDYLKKNPDKQKDYHLFEKTRSHPDKNIVYTAKSALKKTIPLYQRRGIVYATMAAAASLVFFMVRYSGNETNSIAPGIKEEKSIVSVTGKDKDKDKGQHVNFNSEKAKKNKKGNDNNRVAHNKTNKSNQDFTKPDVAEHEDQNIKLAKQTIISNIKLNTQLPTQEIVAIHTFANYDQEKQRFVASIIKDVRKFSDTTSIGKIGWTVANAGISLFNRLTNSEVVMKRDINEYGNVSSFSLKSGVISVSRSNSN